MNGVNGRTPRPRLGELLEAGLAPQQTTPPRSAPDTAGEVAGPAQTGQLAELPGVLPVGWEVITGLRKQASDAIEADTKDRGLDEEDEKQLAQALISRIVGQWATAWALEHPPLSREQTAAVRAAVFNAIYRSGAIQPYLDDAAVENIVIKGFDHVRVKYADRPAQMMPPITPDDGALRAWINDMAANSGHGERQLSPARPMTNFRLEDGSRVAATLLTPRPSVVIRRHRVLRSTLEDLTTWGSVDPVLAAFLHGCVQAKRNLLITGDMDTGKTTMLRALARTIPADEDVVTLETDRELYLDRMPDGPHVFAFEARESGGERVNGKAMGEISVADIFPEALRYGASRVIVGEVRSVEVFAMLDAMSAGGSGSMCTLHARRPRDVLDRLLFLCNRAGLSDGAASKLVSTSVDFIVYLRRHRAPDGRQWRYVSHVLETAGVGESGRPTFTEVFAPRDGDPRAVPQQAPRCLHDLVAEGGFDPALLQHQRGQWARPQSGEASA